MMRVHHIVPHIYKASSGPSHSVPALCSSLARDSVSVTLHALEPGIDRSFNFEVRTYSSRRLPPRLCVSPAMKKALVDVASTSDIMHNHSLWLMPNIYAGTAIRGSQCRLIVSPRGTLSSWALRRSWLRKRIVWAFGQRNTLRDAHCFHATARSELEDIRRLGFTRPVAVIPNSVDIPSLEGKAAFAETLGKRLVFLGRIHPTKGIDTLLRSWKHIEKDFEDWKLIIAGPDGDSYAQSMKALSRELKLRRALFVGAVEGEEKRQLLLSANAFVLSTHSENFGMAVAEALAHSVPAIVTKGAPWEGLEQEGCGWWIDQGETALIECFRQALSLSKTELRLMGEKGRDWMKRDFSHARAGEMMFETYRWLLGGGSLPGWVDKGVGH